MTSAFSVIWKLLLVAAVCVASYFTVCFLTKHFSVGDNKDGAGLSGTASTDNPSVPEVGETPRAVDACDSRPCANITNSSCTSSPKLPGWHDCVCNDGFFKKDGKCFLSCRDSYECNEGVCFNHVCVESNCQIDQDCNTEQHCLDHLCQPVPCHGCNTGRQCVVLDHQAICICDENHHENSQGNCVFTCTGNQDCFWDEVCDEGECLDPCVVLGCAHGCRDVDGVNQCLPPPLAESPLDTDPTIFDTVVAKPSTVCFGDDFLCDDDSFGEPTCINRSSVCDGHNDCFPRQDEYALLCENRDCEEHKAGCADGVSCVHPAQVCNGVTECPDGSDETPERCWKDTCPADEFSCPNRHCQPVGRICDGHYDCIDRWDEQDCEYDDDCGLNGCGENQLCVSGGGPKYKCVCRNGMFMWNGTCFNMDLSCSTSDQCPGDSLCSYSGTCYQCATITCSQPSPDDELSCDEPPTDMELCPCQEGTTQSSEVMDCVPNALYCEGSGDCVEGYCYYNRCVPDAGSGDGILERAVVGYNLVRS